jgi:hypothetical protein
MWREEEIQHTASLSCTDGTLTAMNGSATHNNHAINMRFEKSAAHTYFANA